MNLPDFAYKNVVDLYNVHKNLALGSDDERRLLCKMIVEQTTFDDPQGGWGHKAEKGGAPSKDTMGNTKGGQLIAWDLFNGSTRAPNPSPIQSFNLIPSSQEVRPLNGVDHLMHSTGGGGSDGGDDSGIDALEDRVEKLEQAVAALTLSALKDGDKIALQTDNGKYVTAEGGGGKKADQQPLATDRTQANAWETYTLVKK